MKCHPHDPELVLLKKQVESLKKAFTTNNLLARVEALEKAIASIPKA